jgi:hypothetical protein
VTSFKSINTPVLASVQLVLDPSEFLMPVGNFDDGEIWQAATLDVLIGMSDRPGNNWLGVPRPDLPARLALIDHAYSFGFQGGGVNSAFYQLKQGQPLPDHIRTALEGIIEDGPDPDLYALLEPAELAALVARERNLLAAGAMANI